MKRMKQAVVAVLFIIASHAVAGGGGGLKGGALEITQLLNNVELGAIYTEEAHAVVQQATQIANEITMIHNQLNMYQNMLDNMTSLSTFEWGDVFTELKALQSAVQKGQAIAYSMANLDTAFKSRFQGYGDYFAATYGPGDFRTDYRDWYDTARDGIQGALSAANLQASGFTNEQSILAQLETMSQTSVGRHQALQVGHQISMQQVHQTQKLRELVMSQMQMQSNYLASEAAKDAANQARSERFFNTPSTVVTGNEATYDPATM